MWCRVVTSTTAPAASRASSTPPSISERQMALLIASSKCGIGVKIPLSGDMPSIRIIASRSLYTTGNMWKQKRLLVLSVFTLMAMGATPQVSYIRVPNGGIQPQVVEQGGVVHLLYFSGDPEHGDLSYVQSHDYGRTFSAPLKVN